MGVAEVVIVWSKLPPASSQFCSQNWLRQTIALAACGHVHSIDIRRYGVDESVPEYEIAKQWIICTLERVGPTQLCPGVFDEVA